MKGQGLKPVKQIPALYSKESITMMSLKTILGGTRYNLKGQTKSFYSGGFVSITDKGAERYCSSKKNGFGKLQNLVEHFDQFWKKNLQKLEDLLKKKSNRKR